MKKLFFVFLLFLLLIQTLIFINQNNIIKPQKRELQPYHYAWLNSPEKHGMHIQKHFTQNQIPYMVVTQNSMHGLSKRQKVLHEQLNGIEIEKNNKLLVLLHGKNGRKEDLLPVAERYVLLGFRCILMDLPHHGESQETHLYYTTKASEKVYVDEVLDDVAKHTEMNENELYIWGMSLGGAFAIANVAHSKYPFRGMVLVSTFDRLNKVLRKKSESLFGEFLGEALYGLLEKSLKFFYDFEPKEVNSMKLAERLTLPLYMVHGRNDALIAYQQGQKLFEYFASKEKQFHLDNEGDHHNILVTKHPFYKESGLFLLQKP